MSELSTPRLAASTPSIDNLVSYCDPSTRSTAAGRLVRATAPNEQGVE
jgi:hypothetical protein